MSSPSDVKVGVVGLGNWGTALGNHLACKGYDVLGWARETEIVSGINAHRRNPLFLSEIELCENFKAAGDLAAVSSRPIVVVVLPSSALRSIVPQLRTTSSTLIVSAIKGLDGQTLLTPLQYLSHTKTPFRGAAVLSGPSFAKDIAHRRPSGVVAAAKEESAAREVADLFSCDWMRVYLSTDPLGVELGGITKNVIALAVGVCDGLGLGDSARAGLITRGLAEMMRLAVAMGADVLTLSGLSGMGDLVMTATCDQSRNRTVGLELGRGKRLPEILQALGSVAEGVETTKHVVELARRHNVEMPITFQVERLLKGEVTAVELIKVLITRPTKREIG